MRPEIADLIRPVIYKDLEDSDSVKQYPNVVGMAKNLYFIDHSEPESGVIVVGHILGFFSLLLLTSITLGQW